MDNLRRVNIKETVYSSKRISVNLKNIGRYYYLQINYLGKYFETTIQHNN